jgi:hypothetical protein
MTVEELIDQLQGFNPDSEVRFAAQPSYPMEYSLGETVEVVLGEEDEDTAMVVYLSEGSQLGYLPGEACDELYW